MIDLAPVCSGPTWRNGHSSVDVINKRLDRFLALNSLLPHLRRFTAWSHPSKISNHYPICVEWDTDSSSHLYPFKFNGAWLTDEGFSNMVCSNWISDSPSSIEDYMVSLVYKLKRLKGVVKSWEKNQKMIRSDLLATIDYEIHSLLS